jgi:hypothetical protein
LVGIGTSGIGATPPNTSAISGPLSGSDPYCTKVGSLPGGGFESIWQFSGPNGYVGAFAILGMDFGSVGSSSNHRSVPR